MATRKSSAESWPEKPRAFSQFMFLPAASAIAEGEENVARELSEEYPQDIDSLPVVFNDEDEEPLELPLTVPLRVPLNVTSPLLVE